MGLMLKEEIKSSIGGKIGYLFMRKNLKRFAKRLDASEIGGAMIFGINAPVIKAHGSSDAKAILNAIKQARTFVQADIINKVKDKIKDFNIEGESN
jgi:glycerol-3-phosphate acyltransferase PlsX